MGIGLAVVLDPVEVANPRIRHGESRRASIRRLAVGAGILDHLGIGVTGAGPLDRFHIVVLGPPQPHVEGTSPDPALDHDIVRGRVLPLHVDRPLPQSRFAPGGIAAEPLGMRREFNQIHPRKPGRVHHGGGHLRQATAQPHRVFPILNHHRRHPAVLYRDRTQRLL